MNIPVVVGVTGRRDLREQDRETYAVTTALTKGADQLCTETALEMGLGLISVFSMPIYEYANDFDVASTSRLFNYDDCSIRSIFAVGRSGYFTEFSSRFINR